MIYTVTDVYYNTVSVIFADGSTANVPIQVDSTLEEIDLLVGAFDPSYQDPPTINPNVTVGYSNTTIQPDPAPLSVGSTFSEAYHPVTSFAADYIFRHSGDTAVTDALDEYMLNIVGVPSTGITTNTFVGFLSAIALARSEQVALSTYL